MAGGGWLGQESFWRYVRPLTVVGLVIAGASVVETFLPNPVIVPAWLRMLLLAGIVLPHIGTMVMLNRVGLRSPTDVLNALPLLARLFFGGFVIAMWATFLSTALGPGGTPEKQGDRYYESYRGELTEISRDEYRELEALDQRRFLAIPAAFLALGTAAGFAASRLFTEQDERTRSLG